LVLKIMRIFLPSKVTSSNCICTSKIIYKEWVSVPHHKNISFKLNKNKKMKEYF